MITADVVIVENLSFCCARKTLLESVDFVRGYMQKCLGLRVGVHIAESVVEGMSKGLGDTHGGDVAGVSLILEKDRMIV